MMRNNITTPKQQKNYYFQEDSNLFDYLRTQLKENTSNTNNNNNNNNNIVVLDENNKKELSNKGWNIISDLWYINENDVNNLNTFNNIQKIKLKIIINYFTKSSSSSSSTSSSTNINCTLFEMQRYVVSNMNKECNSSSNEEEDLLPLLYPKQRSIMTNTATTRKKSINNNITTHKIGSVPTATATATATTRKMKSRNNNNNNNIKKRKNKGSSIILWWLLAAISFSIYRNYKFLTNNINIYNTVIITSPSLPSKEVLSTSNSLTTSLTLSKSLTNIPKRKIAFVHIGKTGGSTASTMIRNKCFRTTPSQCTTYTKEHLQEQLLIIGPERETQISKQINSYYHIRPVEIKKYKSFIITIRHPIERMISWYNHYHPLNKLVWFRRRPFFDCYSDLNNMATIGLSSTQHDNCTEVAIACVTGKAVFQADAKTTQKKQPQNRRLKECEHMFYNYHFYISELLQLKQKEIFVLRTEQFWDDWSDINVMLGGSKNVHVVKKVTHSEGKQLVVTDRSISKEGLENVCRVLCTEIQLYKQLIWRGVNLDIEDKKLSIRELEKTCPIQTNVDNCP